MFSGGSASATTVNSGAMLVVLGGGLATDTVSSGGSVISTGIIVLSAGMLLASYPTTATGLTISGTKLGYVLAGGTTSNASIVNYGSMFVSSGGNAVGTTIQAGAEFVYAGGNASANVVKGNAVLVVSSGGVARATTVSAGGQEIVFAGGTASGTIAKSAGGLNITAGGVGSGTIASNGGREVVYAGGSSVSAVISSGGYQVVLSGGAARDATIGRSGFAVISSGGAASSTRINSGGFVLVSSGGATSSTVVNLGGSEEVFAGGITRGTTISSGGAELVSSGGLASGTIVSSGGNLVVLPGGSASFTVLAGGHVISTGVVILSGTTLLSGTSNYYTTVFLSGNMTSTTGQAIGAGELANVLSGGVADTTVIGSGGRQQIYSGGTATGATVSLGGQEVVYAGGFASGTTISYGGGQVALSGGVTVGTQLTNQGAQDVYSGGVASNTVVSSGGYVYIEGGTTSGTVVQAGGAESVYQGFDSYGGFTTTGTTSGTMVEAGGMQSVNAGGVARGTAVSAGGFQVISAGGVASDTVVRSSGIQKVTSGGEISGTVLDVGGTIDLQYLAFQAGGSISLDGATDVLTIIEGGNSEDVALRGSYDGLYFHATADTDGSTLITVDGVACYCRGTRILTERGEVAVEALAIGDMLITRALPDGRAALPLRWIGRRSYSGRFAATNRDVQPVCIHAGALADNVPHRDLWVSPLHALYLDGVLVPAAALVNGISIVQAEVVDQVEYFHLELDGHAVILAECAPAESFVDDDSRGMFHNAGEYRALYPDAPSGPARYCAPRVEEGELLESLRTKLAARAGLTAPADTAPGHLIGNLEQADHGKVTGWVRDEAAPDAPVRLHILAGEALLGEVLANRFRGDLLRAGIGSGRHGFSFAIPGELPPDRRHSIHVRRVVDGQDIPGAPRIAEPAGEQVGRELSERVA